MSTGLTTPATSHSRRPSRPSRPARARGRLRAHGGTRRVADAHHARPRGIHRGADQRVPRDRECRRSALHPASRRAGGLPARARRQDHRLRRLRRQPAVHHAGQSRRQSQGASVPDRLCAPAAGEDLGRGARGRRRRRADRAPDARGLQGAARAGDPVHRLGLERELSAAHPAAVRGRRRRCCPRRARPADRGARGGGGNAARRRQRPAAQIVPTPSAPDCRKSP